MDIQNLERKIKDKKLRIGIEKSAEQGIVCGNVLICCIASLNDYINRSEQKQAAYSQRRAYLAKQAKDLLRMDVGYIKDKIYRLSPECYPSLKATGRVCDMLADSGRKKAIDNSFVPDKLMRTQRNSIIVKAIQRSEGQNLIESMSPDVLKQIKHEEEEEQSFWMHNAKAVLSGDETLESMVRIQCDEDPNTLHYGQLLICIFKYRNHKTI